MIQQIVFLLILYILGLLIVFNIRVNRSAYFFFLSAFIWGSLTWVGTVWLLSIVSVRISWLSIGIILSLIVVVLIFFIIRNHRFVLNQTEKKAITLSLITNLLLILFFSYFNFSYASPDTFFNILAGRVFAESGWHADPSHYVIWGAYLPFLQSASTLLGMEYIYGFIPVISLGFLISIAPLFHQAFKIGFGNHPSHLQFSIAESFINIPLHQLMTFLAMLLIISTTYVQQFMVYIHSNWIAGIYFTILLVGTWVAFKTEEPKWLVTIGLATLALTLSRVETIFIIAIPVFLLMQKSKFHPSVVRFPLVPVMILNLLWSIQKLWRGLDLEGDKGSDVFLYGAICFFFIMLVLLFIFPVLKKWKIPWNLLIVLGFSLLFLAAAIWRPALMMSTIKASYLNFSETAQWNLAWVILPPMLLFAILTKREPFEDFFRLNIFAYLILLIVFAPIRGESYRVGWFDSGNRMMLHIYPTIIFYTLYKAGLLSIRYPQKNVASGDQPII